MSAKVPVELRAIRAPYDGVRLVGQDDEVVSYLWQTKDGTWQVRFIAAHAIREVPTEHEAYAMASRMLRRWLRMLGIDAEVNVKVEL